MCLVLRLRSWTAGKVPSSSRSPSRPSSELIRSLSTAPLRWRQEWDEDTRFCYLSLPFSLSSTCFLSLSPFPHLLLFVLLRLRRPSHCWSASLLRSSGCESNSGENSVWTNEHEGLLSVALLVSGRFIAARFLRYTVLPSDVRLHLKARVASRHVCRAPWGLLSGGIFRPRGKTCNCLSYLFFSLRHDLLGTASLFQDF